MSYEEIIMDYKTKIIELESQNAKYFQALSLIAAPARPDGTYNRCREACEKLATEAIKNP